MTVLSGAPLWILLFSALLLAPPLDPQVIVGDFEATEYAGKLNPLSDPSIVVDDIFFPSHNETCHAWLYSKPTLITTTNEDGEETTATSIMEPKAVIVMATGLGAQKDFGLDRYAQPFVQAGYSVFMFDYRSFASSTGTPRNLVSPKSHVQDYHAAIDFIESNPSQLNGKVDTSKILLWGTSFSGGHVLEVASQRLNDKHILGVVSQVPHLSGAVAAKRGLKKRGIIKLLRLVWAALQDAARHYVGLPPVSVKVIGADYDIAVLYVDADEVRRHKEKQPPQLLGGWINQMPARAVIATRFYAPLETLKKAAADDNQILFPVLIIGAQLDDLCPSELIEEAHGLIKRSQLLLPKCTHFQIYDPKYSVMLTEEMIKFYNACLVS